jgi:16S rRNA A1518/A1519 N6-dimethyltransferase RsmA/KsgA/DIM1 with predicted DNA glycosylase/AP lyase activity
VCGDILRQDPLALLGAMADHGAALEADAAASAGGRAQDEQQPAAQAATQQEGQQQRQGQGTDGKKPARPIKVVANLPYYITKDCLTAWLPLGGHVASLIFMLQVRAACSAC